MNWLTAVPAFVGAGVGSMLVGVLLKAWLDHKLSVLSEQRQLQARRREASAAVAEILGAWVRSSYLGPSNEDLWQLQVTYWRHVLWLDKEIVVLLAGLLSHKADAATPGEVIVKARKVLLGLSTPDIDAAALVSWPAAK